MAEQQAWYGSVGPFLFDDTDAYADGVYFYALRGQQAYLEQEPVEDFEVVRLIDLTGDLDRAQSYALALLWSDTQGPVAANYFRYIVDPNEADQGVTGNNRSIKAYIDVIGSEEATIFCLHSGTGATTTFTCATAITIPNNITLFVQHGALLDRTGGDHLTINGRFVAEPYICLDDNTVNHDWVVFGEGSVDHIYLEWWGPVNGVSPNRDSLQQVFNALPTNGLSVKLLAKDYLVNSAVSSKPFLLRGSGVGATRILSNLSVLPTYVYWTAETAFSLDDIVFPTVYVGQGGWWAWKCTKAGTTGVAEPAWLMTTSSYLAGTWNDVITDGSAEWTAFLFSSWAGVSMTDGSIIYSTASDSICADFSIGYDPYPMFLYNNDPFTKNGCICFSTIVYDAATYVQNILIENVEVINSKCHGIGIGRGRNYTIRNCNVHNFWGTGVIGAYVMDTDVVDNVFSEGSDMCIDILCNGDYWPGGPSNYCENIRVTGNSIADTHSGGIGFGGVKNGLIVGNTINNTRLFAISPGYRGVGIPLCENITVDGNNLTKIFMNYGSAAGMHRDIDAISETGGSYGAIDALVVGSLNVTGNVIADSIQSQSLPTPALKAYYGIRCGYANDAVVVGNEVDPGMQVGISFGNFYPNDVRLVVVNNITLSGEQTLDGKAAVAGDLVLVTAQTDGEDNGPYIVSAGAWTRKYWAPYVSATYFELMQMFLHVTEGDVFAGTTWYCTAPSGGILGTTELEWEQRNIVHRALAVGNKLRGGGTGDAAVSAINVGKISLIANEFDTWAYGVYGALCTVHGQANHWISVASRTHDDGGSTFDLDDAGVLNYLPKWKASGETFQSSILSDDGTIVTATSNVTGSVQLRAQGGAAATAGIELKDAAGTPNVWWLSNGVVSFNDGKFGIYDKRQTAWRMVIGTDGKIGFRGITAPTAEYALGAITANTVLAIYESGADLIGFGISANVFRFHVNANTTDFVWYDAPAGNALFVIKGTGNVGIGATPNCKLDITVASSGAVAEAIRLGRTGDAYRYNSIYNYSMGSGLAHIQFKVHTGATPTSQYGMLKLQGNGMVTIGDGSAGVDFGLTFDGETNDGLITWMEDEDYFKFGDSILFEDSEPLYFGTGVDMSIDYNGTQGNIRTDLVAASDLNIDCGTDKTIVLEETVWDDLRVVPGSFDRPGVSDPTIVAYDVNGGGVSTYLWQFALNNIASFTVQLPHSYKQGTDITVHIHWTPGPRGNEENGATVGWKIDYAWANINDAFQTMLTADLSDACDGTDHKHQMTPEVTIDGHTASKNISSMLICNVKRTDTGTDDTWAGTASGERPLLLEIDFHYQIDTIGSRQSSAK